MARKINPDKQLDKDIEQLYYRHGNGRQINIMKIGKLFADAKTSHLAGATLEDAVKAAIEKHCDPV